MQFESAFKKRTTLHQTLTFAQRKSWAFCPLHLPDLLPGFAPGPHYYDTVTVYNTDRLFVH